MAAGITGHGLNLWLRMRERPLMRAFAERLHAYRLQRCFPGSGAYWEKRYREGGNSGAGSYHRLARFKADTINDFVREKHIASVLELGCGDGNQLRLAQYPCYTGVDIAPWAIGHCKDMFQPDPTKEFFLLGEAQGRCAELALSLDVIYHLVEDAVFEAHMAQLLDSATRYAIIYSSNTEDYNYRSQHPHVRHREFSCWIMRHRPQWRLLRHIPNLYPFLAENPQHTSLAEFFIYEKV